MTTLDVKSMSWVDDMYEKFEAMCAEVEETMYQESVKYVENQVKTVGDCVKRFCADVIQDLVPLSSDDSLKPENIRLNLVQYADDGIYDKTVVYAKKERVKSESEHLSGDSYLASQSDEVVDNRLSSGSYDSSSQYKLPTDESTALKSPGLCVQKSGTEELFLCSTDESESETKFLPSEISNPENVDPKLAFLSHGRESTTELGKMSDEINGAVECMPVTSSSFNPAVDEFVNDEDTLKMSDAGSYELDSDDLEKEAFQVSEQIGKLKLGESCVLVDSYEHFSVPHSKERSYKKKIKDVLYLRRWSRSKNPEELNLNVLLQEEMNTTNHGSTEITASNYALESGNLNLESNCLESGWEFL